MKSIYMSDFTSLKTKTNSMKITVIMGAITIEKEL